MKRFKIEIKDVTNQDVSSFEEGDLFEIVKLLQQLKDLEKQPTVTVTDKLSAIAKIKAIDSISLQIVVDELLNSFCFSEPQLYVDITGTTLSTIDIDGNTTVYKPQKRT